MQQSGPEKESLDSMDRIRAISGPAQGNRRTIPRQYNDHYYKAYSGLQDHPRHNALKVALGPGHNAIQFAQASLKCARAQ